MNMKGDDGVIRRAERFREPVVGGNRPAKRDPFPPRSFAREPGAAEAADRQYRVPGWPVKAGVVLERARRHTARRGIRVAPRTSAP